MCGDRRKLPCSWVNSWHCKHRRLTSSARLPLKLNIFDLSPPPSTCSDPGPWHVSQLCASAPFTFSTLSQWGVPEISLKRSSWQPLHVSEPTYLPVLEIALGASCFSCSAEFFFVAASKSP